jgi:multiple antibiotic resistance protein
MLETALVALTTFFATIGPIDVAMIFATITPENTRAERRAMAVKGVLIATVLMMAIAVVGELLLARLGISLPAFRTAGGILLLLIGINLVFARTTGGTSTTPDETAEATQKADVSVFPLATPLIAGPGAMGAAVLLMAGAEGDLSRQAVVLGALAAILLLTLVMLLLAGEISRLLGVTGLNVISRVVGVLLSALAVQFIFDGIRNSGLVG